MTNSFAALVSMTLALPVGAWKWNKKNASGAVCHHSFDAPFGTNCPATTWVDAMVAADPAAGKTFMDVGCNKGNTAIKWMERWDMSDFWSTQKWMDFYKQRGANTDVCAVSPKVTKAVKDASSTGKPIGICVEPMKANLDILRDASNSLGFGSTEFGAFHIVQAAVMDKATPGQKVEFPDGLPGQENLGLQNSLVESQVPVKTVDGIVTELSIQKIDILLVDTEGADPAVLRGASNTLKSVRYLEFEVHRDLARTVWGDTTLRSVVDELDIQGFECYWAGNNAQLLSIKNCWDDKFERGTWANVVCVKRGDVWAGVLQDRKSVV